MRRPSPIAWKGLLQHKPWRAAGTILGKGLRLRLSQRAICLCNEVSWREDVPDECHEAVGDLEARYLVKTVALSHY